MIWEKENRIRDRQFDNISVSKRINAISVAFDETERVLDSDYEVRILFTNVVQGENWLSNFQVDNFITLTE